MCVDTEEPQELEVGTSNQKRDRADEAAWSQEYRQVQARKWTNKNDFLDCLTLNILT